MIFYRSISPACQFRVSGNRLFQLLSVVSMWMILQGCASSNNLQDGTMSSSEMGALLIQERSLEPHVISAGDLIEISVWGYDEFNTERTVSTRGFISVPLIGEMHVRGLTREEFKEALISELSEYIQGEINATVSINTGKENVVSVLGSVNRPDNYEVIENITLFEILSKAGGATDQADLRNITIYQNRGKNKPVKIDLTRYLYGEDNPSSITMIYPGDILYIPREENVIREMTGFLRDVVLLFGMFRVFN